MFDIGNRVFISPGLSAMTIETGNAHAHVQRELDGGYLVAFAYIEPGNCFSIGSPFPAAVVYVDPDGNTYSVLETHDALTADEGERIAARLRQEQPDVSWCERMQSKARNDPEVIRLLEEIFYHFQPLPVEPPPAPPPPPPRPWWRRFVS